MHLQRRTTLVSLWLHCTERVSGIHGRPRSRAKQGQAAAGCAGCWVLISPRSPGQCSEWSQASPSMPSAHTRSCGGGDSRGQSPPGRHVGAGGVREGTGLEPWSPGDQGRWLRGSSAPCSQPGLPSSRWWAWERWRAVGTGACSPAEPWEVPSAGGSGPTSPPDISGVLCAFVPRAPSQ